MPSIDMSQFGDAVYADKDGFLTFRRISESGEKNDKVGVLGSYEISPQGAPGKSVVINLGLILFDGLSVHSSPLPDIAPIIMSEESSKSSSSPYQKTKQEQHAEAVIAMEEKLKELQARLEDRIKSMPDEQSQETKPFKFLDLD